MTVVADLSVPGVANLAEQVRPEKLSVPGMPLLDVYVR